MRTCELCDAEVTKFLARCEEHQRCDGCGTREGLCLYVGSLMCDDCRKIEMDRRVAAFDGDTSCTDNVVCPHCGREDGDSWELSEGKQECGDCGREFEMTRCVDVTYSTVKA